MAPPLPRADEPTKRMPLSFFQQALISLFSFINDYIPWHKLPTPLGVINLLTFRWELRLKNLYDTYPTWANQGNKRVEPMPTTRFEQYRHSDGKFNSEEYPRMGCSGMRFGRNVPRKHTKAPSHEELMTPNPRDISEKLLARDTFKPATIVNLLAAAWIQFQVHDWANHETSTKDKWRIPLNREAGDNWSDPDMEVLKTKRAEALDETDERYPAYNNTDTMWWDGSQIYGSCEAETAKLRSKAKGKDGNGDGKLAISEHPLSADPKDDFLPRGADGLPLTGFSQNWWLGLELLHTLFAKEHNAIADKLNKHYPSWSGDDVFDTARLINCALMAKIHTVEWTPAILANPVLKIAMNANWWGLLGKQLHKIAGRISNSEVVSGIPGSGAEQDGAPYCLTEEFVSVYRLHPLIPDDIAFFKVADGSHHVTTPIADVAFAKALDPMEHGGLSVADAFYSFGINYPGAITVHNTPNFLRDLHTPDGRHLDMGVVDILRDRERGVPRYNEFRRLFRLKPAADFMELTGGNQRLADEVKAVYANDIETVDLLIGCLCEPLPAGFGFSDTAFRVFILMASRRIKSDRFLATDFKPEVYSYEGINWVQETTMKEVLIRHYPALKASLKDVDNAFAPWHKIGLSSLYTGKETNKPEDVAPMRQQRHGVHVEENEAQAILERARARLETEQALHPEIDGTNGIHGVNGINGVNHGYDIMPNGVHHTPTW